MIRSTKLKMFFTFLAMFALTVAVPVSYGADNGGSSKLNDSENTTRGFINFMINKLDNSPTGYVEPDGLNNVAPSKPMRKSKPVERKSNTGVRGFAFYEFIDSVEGDGSYVEGVECDGCGRKYNKQQKKRRGYALTNDAEVKVIYRKFHLEISEHKLISGSTLFTGISSISPSLSGFASQIDTARLTLDVPALAMLAIQLSHIEKISSVYSKELNSGMLVAEGSKILKDRKKDDFVESDFTAIINSYKIVFDLTSEELSKDLTSKKTAGKKPRGYASMKDSDRDIALANIVSSLFKQTSTLNRDKTSNRSRGFVGLEPEQEKPTHTAQVGVINKSDSALHVYIDGRCRGTLPAFTEHIYFVIPGDTTIKLYSPSGKEVVETTTLAENETFMMSLSGGKDSDKMYKKNKEDRTRGYTTTVTVNVEINDDDSSSSSSSGSSYSSGYGGYNSYNSGYGGYNSYNSGYGGYGGSNTYFGKPAGTGTIYQGQR